MATELGSSKSAKTAAKNDAFVNAQLARAEKRVRALDVGAALLGFAALVCVFAAALSLADRAWSLPPWARQLSLVSFLVGGGAYLYFTLARPLLYRVNPYYAAQRVEQTMPGAKNSVVNWLDLQQQKLPPAIRAAVGQKAAKDLSKADIDGAFSGRRLAWVGALAGACAAGLIACLIWIGGDSFFHLRRVFAPFSFGSPAPTTLTITRPEGGDETVTIKQPVFIAARVEGKLPDPKGPDAVKLLYRYEEDGPYLVRLMRHDGGEFTATVSANDVRDGFWYKVTAGDVETPEYRVNVRATPLLTKVQATYHFRSYVGRADEEHYARRPFRLEALRGTEVTLLVDTNRPVKQAYLVLEGKDGPERFPAKVVGDDGKAFRITHVIDRTTRYRLKYATPDNEEYADPTYQDLFAVPDNPPEVTITAPGRDTQLPCNSVLQVEGIATDDVGVKSIALKMRVTKLPGSDAKGPELKAKAYRSDKELRLPSGGYATSLKYKDFVDLKTVQTPDGKPFAPAAGMELEYWLEASDACDYPQPNVSESKHYRAQLIDAEKDPEKQQNERDQAKREQQKHEQEQNDALKKEEKSRQEKEQRQKEDARQEKDAASNKSEKQDGKTEPKQPEGDPGASADPAQQKQDEKVREEAEKLKRALEEQQRREHEEKHHASAKPDPKEEPAKPSEGKELGPKPDTPPSAPKPEQKSDPQQQSAATKPPPPPDQKKDSAQKKDEGKTSDQVCPRGECKNDGKSANPDNPKTVPKDTPSPAANKAEGKSAGKDNPGDDPKAKPKSGGSPMSSEGKPEPKPNDDTKNAVAKDDKSADGNRPPKVDPAGAKPEDVANEAQELKASPGPGRKDAARQLDKIAQQAKDEKAREAAKKALEDAGLKPPPEAEAKQPPQTKNAQVEAAKPKDDPDPKKNKGTAKSSDQKDVPKAEDKNLGKPPIDDKTPEPDDPLQKKELQQKREEYLKKVEEQLRKQGDFDEKKWQEFLQRYGDKINPPEMSKEKERPPFVPEENLLKPDDPTPPPATKDNKPRDDKATTLQLQKFMDAIDKKTLQKAGITEEQWRAFAKQYEDLAKREEAAAPQNKGPLVGTGSTRTNPGAKSNPNDPGAAGRTQPPPGYRDAWGKFTRDLSTPDEKK
jgi:hypothetical protein